MCDVRHTSAELQDVSNGSYATRTPFTSIIEIICLGIYEKGIEKLSWSLLIELGGILFEYQR